MFCTPIIEQQIDGLGSMERLSTSLYTSIGYHSLVQAPATVIIGKHPSVSLCVILAFEIVTWSGLQPGGAKCLVPSKIAILLPLNDRRPASPHCMVLSFLKELCPLPCNSPVRKGEHLHGFNTLIHMMRVGS